MLDDYNDHYLQYGCTSPFNFSYSVADERRFSPWPHPAEAYLERCRLIKLRMTTGGQRDAEMCPWRARFRLTDAAFVW